MRGFLSIQLADDACGIVHQPNGKAMCLCVSEEALIDFAGNAAAAQVFKKFLRDSDLYIGGHGGVGSAQENVSIIRKGRVVHKPRFWRLDYGKLEARMIEAVAQREVEPSADFVCFMWKGCRDL